MSGESFNWQAFLGRWQEEWVPRDDSDMDAYEDDGETFVLPGRPGADEAAIAAAEERLGRRLPPSYRAFLAVSDGWHVDETVGVYQLGGAADIRWFGDPHGMTSLYEENLGDDPREEDVRLAGMWKRALQLETDSDMSHALLDPGDVDADGEWALYVYKGWSGELPRRYPSFRAYMEAMYRRFHADRSQDTDFVNATTRAQDSHVDEARVLAVLGRYEEALPLLKEARSFGRPRSAALFNQLRQFMHPHETPGYGNLVADPLYLPELLPVEAMSEVTGRWQPGGDDHWLRMMVARGVARKRAEAVRSAVRDGNHRYAPDGSWGRAVNEARGAARWGNSDAAWRVLRAALPRWKAPGPLLIAPVGLLADPILGPLITPERGRELLATPRDGQQGPAPEPVPDLDPPGLVWLAETATMRQAFDGYRCVWVEGSDPARLPALIGEDGAELGAPVDSRTAFWRAPRSNDREGVQPWEDRALVSVGRTAEGWAFAFDGRAHSSLSTRFVSPAQAASVSGRAVVVCRESRPSSPGGRSATFHLSVAEQGVELYAFTVQGAEITRSGEIPEALDPARLFRPEDAELGAEIRMLAALHTELGLSLPRFALTRGKLPTFTTRSWTRAPREGEGYATLTFVRHRP